MVNEEPLTRWEVRDMIYRAIAEYDIKQDARHRENSVKLDRNATATISLKDDINKQFQAIRESISETSGVRKLIAWGIPILVAILSIVAEIIRSSK